MIALLLAALAGPADVPLPGRGISLQGGEVRIGQALYQWPVIGSPRGAPRFPWWNASLTAGFVVGGRRFGVELGAQSAVGRMQFAADGEKWSYGWWRTEPRLGVRWTHPSRVFGALGGAMTFARTDVLAAGWVTVGWAGRGEHVRPMVALEGRVAPMERYYVGCFEFSECSIRTNPAGAGAHLSVGLSLGDGGSRVRRGSGGRPRGPGNRP